ncbi:protein UPSTREAM OF FLC-like [Punica granatum]|uniref:SOSEKI DIX-like domain-containing protein n=2 Tax=Punica granatum TaxID=22663 RepID=A0A218WC65_PUNGR|nr:protein UPSTREAM OF FLC-like [Punica granatum]OWM70099.1 hypothetical protein CDL15_Pgr025949 [Punica granatum]PKI35220.1 hypothetical protein CRG98_044386 [Punica granatum]
MSINSRHKAEVWVPKKYQDSSPERTKVWVEPKSNHKHKTERKVAVVYYLSQNGLLEHPHFIEVPLSSPEGLYLRDMMNRLNHLRGAGMANMYAWSSKRAYKSGYVWQDLSENDFIYPCHGQEYILKGSRLLESSLSFRSVDTVSSETNSSGDLEHLRFSDVLRRSKNRSFTSLDDLNINKTYMAKTMGHLGARTGSNNASTQTEEKGRKVSPVHSLEDEEEVEELSKEEISPPPCSNNSSRELGREGMEIGHSRDRQQALSGPADIRNQIMEGERPSGRIRASAVLMQLIMCGSKNGEDIVLPHTRE